MNITDAILDIAAVLRSVPNIKTVPASLPGPMPSSALPVAITVVREGEWREHVSSGGWNVRTFQVLCYVKPVGQGTLDEGYMKAVNVLDAVGKAFAAVRASADCPMWMKRAAFEDSGHVILQYGNVDYHGFTVTIRSQLPITF